MASNSILSRELKSLREDLSIGRKERTGETPPSGAAVSETASPANQAAESTGERQLHGQLGELVKEITDLVEDAEKNVSAHPAMTVAAAVLVGVLVGSLLARR